MDKALKLIFQPFFSKKESQGAGLGLSMTEKIVKEHGGKIDIESEPGKGTVFRMYLPTKGKTDKSGSDN